MTSVAEVQIGEQSIRSRFRGAIFVLALLAFVGVGIDYLNIVFTTSTRWVFLTLLIVSLIPHGELFAAFRARYTPILLVYLLWCFLTGLWSDVQTLSMLKASAFIIVVTAFLAGGQSWVNRLQPQHSIFFILPVVVAALFSSISAHSAQFKMGTGVSIYQGLTGNPNYLGLISAASLPLPIYRAYIGWRNGANRQAFFWSVLTVAVALLLWRSGSRASLLCGIIIVGAFALVVSSGRRAAMAVLLVFAAGAISVAAPELQQGVYQRVIVKNTRGDDAFFSRRATWEKTYDAAKEGGVLGLGYGVSAGFSDYSFGLTSNTYGREKGNAQLAVWEETGLVGLALYAIFLLALFQELLGGLLQTRGPEQRAEFALVIGLIAGLLAQSVFEAWWTSPGSMESAVFWSTVGVATALSHRYRLGQQSQLEADTRPFAVHEASG
jgi:O-antigen ligase